MVDIRLIPRTECLKDTYYRVLPYWYDVIVPEIKVSKFSSTELFAFQATLLCYSAHLLAMPSYASCPSVHPSVCPFFLYGLLHLRTKNVEKTPKLV